ncbi:class F sortase [Phycicoccus sp. BSK3Z-2]|uniref:Class F sortase n=1 Tax=Phycicoccus avicenniae TaxID=2828860 RepID=A0A941HYP3_9MICO|nr:class F sortase [Phycicoccus avicenniae]MBR7742057.1 class F sortase [Phycicoccus avicenniae]
MSSSDPSSRWRHGALAAAVVALLATGGLASWAATRPAPVAGDGVAALSEPAATPTPRPSVRAVARPADPESVARSRGAAPTALSIPDLGVEADVRGVGVEADGSMTIPAEPTSVGWYRFGAVPADPAGHTVIAGHVATREDGPGALAPLLGAEEGMRVEVVDADGTAHAYEVVGRESIRKQSLPVDRIFARDGDPLLVLVTCGGEYVPELRAHTDNVVVTARPIG